MGDAVTLGGETTARRPPDPLPRPPCRPFAALAAVLLACLAATPAGAQQERAEGAAVDLDTASLADGPYARMGTLLEKTIFRVNVLTLRVRLGPEAAARVAALAGRRPPPAALEDSIARAAGRSTDALAVIEFLRTVSLGQFVDAVRSNLRRAAADGYLSEADARRIGEAIPRWFAFLDERKARRGDRILYRIRGDTLRTVFLAADGRPLLDQTDVGPERRLAVLGSYYARGSDFREGLIRSVLEGEI